MTPFIFKLKLGDKANCLNLVYSDYYIIKDTLLLNEKIKAITDELIFEKEFEISSNSELHDEPFYHNWSKQHNIILRKEDELKFKIYEVYEGEKQYIGAICEGQHYQYFDSEVFAYPLFKVNSLRWIIKCI